MSVELYKEVTEVRKELSENGSEMGIEQQAFICGLLKKYKPRKIVEVGVAAGATTAVILNCIKNLELDAELHSIDISKHYYKDKNKETGFLAEEYKGKVSYMFKHILHIGILPDYLEEIGDEIDFIILDTVHELPGEVLDFLVCLPTLKNGAVVVMHDVALNHHRFTFDSYATRVLWSSVVGEKIECDEDAIIGAFLVNEDTRKYIWNVFSALLITWTYFPMELDKYRLYISKNYDSDLLKLYDTAVSTNKDTLMRRCDYEKACVESALALIRLLKEKENVYIYGNGIIAQRLKWLLVNAGIEVKGNVISDNQEKNGDVRYISEVEDNIYTILLGMSKKNQAEVCQSEMPANWIGLDDLVIDFLRENTK
uniref:class I SAM-dependent methyltransferase n=1 Tax=Acetatifactor sp. TaxID=1872090 RepID=UPI004056660C